MNIRPIRGAARLRQEHGLTADQGSIVLILLVTMGLFIWGRWRHDIVALAALLTSVLVGLVPASEAFSGFGHPAVITVACILILSGALQATGALDALVRNVMPAAAGPSLTIGLLSGIVALLSSFMNNVGALALLMPVAIQTAARLRVPSGQILMPLAFGSLLGGMTTLIGTPPNLIVSSFRVHDNVSGFAMFDFAPVGVAVAAAGLAFIAIIGWRLVPHRERRGVEGFETGAYLTEARVLEGSKAAGMLLYDLEQALESTDAQIIGLVHDEEQIAAPHPFRTVSAGDILVIEADPGSLGEALSTLGLTLAVEKTTRNGHKQNHETTAERPLPLQSSDVVLMELAVRPRAEIVGLSAAWIGLRTRFGINLLALSRAGERTTSRLRSTPIEEGDLLLVQGTPEAISEFANRFGCVPLAERKMRIPDPQKAAIAGAIMAGAVGGAAFGLMPAAISFSAGVLALVVFNIVPVRRIYDAIEWPVIVLLGALLPVAGAISSTGAADVLARALMDTLAGGNAIIALTLLLIVTMTLSDVMNNAATAAVMCPIAVGAATQLGVNPDAFLMAVAVGSSCAFLTPIGHQNNVLILGPGGFRFTDYWRLGLPLEVIVVAVAVPMLLWVWPLGT
jgi:di/tricarboxylate transporter